MTNGRIFGPAILCPCCKKPSFLPHRTPLGTFEGLESPPMGEWPAIFLCRACGQLSEQNGVSDDYVDPSPQPYDLWRIACVCVRHNFAVHHAIYTTFEPNSPEIDVRHFVIRCAVTLRCSEGHDFVVTDEAMRELTRYRA